MGFFAFAWGYSLMCGSRGQAIHGTDRTTEKSATDTFSPSAFLETAAFDEEDFNNL